MTCVCSRGRKKKLSKKARIEMLYRALNEAERQYKIAFKQYNDAVTGKDGYR